MVGRLPLNDCPRRAAARSHCAYSGSLSLVPSDRPRNCFGVPSCLAAPMIGMLPRFVETSKHVESTR